MYRVVIITPNNKKHSSRYRHGFSIYSNGNSFDFHTKDKEILEKWIQALSEYCLLTNFEEKYRTLDLLGIGGYGRV